MSGAVSRLRWRRVAVPFRATVANAQAVYRTRESLLIEVETDRGRRGIGEAALPPGASFGHDGEVIDAFMAAAAVVGSTAGGGWDALRLPAHEPGRWSAALACGVETALADLAARASGLPLYRWLAKEAGIATPRGVSTIRVNGLVDFVEPEAAARHAATLAASGFRTIKLKVGGDPDRSIATVAAVRAAVGRDVELRCDANRAWRLEEARAFLRACAPYSVALCEEPLAEPGEEDYRLLAKLRAVSPVRLAVDESTRTVESLGRVLAAKAADALVVKPMASGLREGLAIVRLAREAALPTIVTTTFDLAPGTAVAMHLAALAGQPRPASGLATIGLLVNALGRGVPEVREGKLTVGDEPGLGVELDNAAVETYSVGPWEERAA